MTALEELKPCRCNNPDAIHEKDYCGFKMIECETCQIAVLAIRGMERIHAGTVAWNRRADGE